MHRYAMLLLASVASVAVAAEAHPARMIDRSPSTDSGGIFIAHFMTPDSTPWPFDLTISDGSWVQRFDGVTYVSTAVPESATYTYAWKTTGHRLMEQVPLAVPRAETMELYIYAIEGDSIVPRTRAYLGYEEKGANASLSWLWDSVTNTLQTTTAFEPGKRVHVIEWIDDDLLALPNYALVSGPEADRTVEVRVYCSDDGGRTWKLNTAY